MMARKFIVRLGLNRARLKSFIVRLAITGMLPMQVADFLIQRGGLNDA